MLDGVAAMHEARVAHGNLNPANVIMETHGKGHAAVVRPRVGGFGLIKRPVPGIYTAPEVLLPERKDGHQAEAARPAEEAGLSRGRQRRAEDG